MYISVVTLFADDVDRAVDFYTKKLGWEKTMDVSMGEGGRWVTVAPKGAQTSFTITEPNEMWPDKKAGGHTGYVIEVDDVYKAYDQLKNAGVEFEEQPRTEPWGGWASFKDSEGNIQGLHSAVPAGVSRN